MDYEQALKLQQAYDRNPGEFSSYDQESLNEQFRVPGFRWVSRDTRGYHLVDEYYMPVSEYGYQLWKQRNSGKKVIGFLDRNRDGIDDRLQKRRRRKHRRYFLHPY